MVRSSYSHPVCLSPGTPALLSRCSFDQWNSDSPLRRSPVLSRGVAVAPWGCSLIGQPGWLRCSAPAGFLPAVAWTGESLFGTSPVLVSRGDVLSPLLVRLLSVGRRRPLVPGHRSRCLTTSQGGSVCRIAAHSTRGGIAAQAVVEGESVACVTRVSITVCAIGRQSEPPRWGKRPVGPFPSVGASCDSWRSPKRPGGEFAAGRATAPEAPHVAAPGGVAGHQTPGDRCRQCQVRIDAHCAPQADYERPGRRSPRVEFRRPRP